MKISIVCSDLQHPVYPCLLAWRERHQAQHQIEICSQPAQLSGGDILFLISCHDKIGPAIRQAYRTTLVMAAEDLIDSGEIWAQQTLHLQGHELADEINQLLFAAEMALMDYAVAHLHDAQPRPQQGEPSYYRKRTPEDSRIDPQRSIAEQFNLLRVADLQRFPAFFDFRGYRYRIILEKVGETPS